MADNNPQRPIVYSCSGCSSAAQMANYMAVQMDRKGTAEMSCIAGVGGNVKKLVKTAQSGRKKIVIDGCPLACAKACLANHGITPALHFELTSFGVKKQQHQDFDREQADHILKQIEPEIEMISHTKPGGRKGVLLSFSVVALTTSLSLTDSFGQDLVTFQAPDKKFGYTNSAGNEMVTPKYHEAYPFSEGLAAVGLNRKYGFIDSTGAEVIPIIYEGVGNFSEGLAAIRMKGKWGYIDRSGKTIIEPGLSYAIVYTFQDGLAKVYDNYKYGYIDKTGKEVIPVLYDQGFSFSNGRANVSLNGRTFCIDKSGNEVP